MSQPSWIITCDELKKELASKNAPGLLDVREQRKNSTGPTSTAASSSRSAISTVAPASFSKDDNIVAYCAVGGEAFTP